MINKTIAAIILAAGLFTLVPVTYAQSGPSAQTTANSSSSAIMDQDIQMLRLDIRSKKKQLIAANLNLTDSEATKFWPVYDRYTADLVQINNEKYALIKKYAEEWGTMSDEQALDLTKRALAVEEQVSQLRIRYIPIFNETLQGKKAATFFQIERRLQAMIDLQLTSQLPLVQAQE